MSKPFDAPARRALLRPIPIFKSLGDDELRALAERATELPIDDDEIILREGETGESMFVIAAGSVHVYSDVADEEVSLARLQVGDFFGEQALLTGAGRERNASARAVGDVTLIEVTRADFEAILARDRALASALDQEGEEQILFKLGQQSTLFRTLPLSGEAASWFQEETFRDGEIVFHQGDPGDRFYLIVSGTACVLREGSGEGAPTVARLEPGQCFGELAIVKKEPRAATIRAEGELRVLSLAGDKLLDYYARLPELRDFLDALRHVYLLPGHGALTLHPGTFMGMESITTVNHLLSGRQVVSRRVVGKPVYSVSTVGEIEGERAVVRYEQRARGVFRELTICDGKVVAATVQGEWPELGELHAMVLDETPMQPWQIAVFCQRGQLRLERELPLFEDSDMVCACAQVTRGTLRRAVAGGCRTVAQLAERTGASLVCGACSPQLHELVGRSDLEPVELVDVLPITPDVRSFRLRTLGAPPKRPKPGQHIIVQSRIGGRWIQRAYTLSSAADETGYQEITVKREERGVFSRWLWDNAKKGTDLFIRISAPRGEFYLDDDDLRPVVFFAGGIGVTPALAMCRTLAARGSRRPFHLDFSASSREQAAYADELVALGKRCEALQVDVRITRERGRITAADVAGILKQSPDAVVYICGTEGYQRDVIAHLRRCGIPSNRIRVEEFTPVAKPSKAIASMRGSLPPMTTRPRSSSPVSVCPVPSRRDSSVHSSVRAPVSTEVNSGQRTVLADAEAYLRLFYGEKAALDALPERLAQVRAEIQKSGTYLPTYDELAYGAKVAWRNSNRCIGRLFWQGLHVRDMRHLTTEEEMFTALVEHIRLATNGGNLRAVMTVFAPAAPGRPGIRIWNPQLIRYAGYRTPYGGIIGDPAQISLTEACLDLGWKGGPRTRFDILPLVIQLPGRAPKLFELPADAILEVPISHPTVPWFADLGLRWYALPAVSNVLMDLGGLSYTAAPFNGWYMGTEIGARNFGDETRYNMLPAIAERMGLDTRSDRTLWKDRAILELNVAVLHSFERANVKMLDHHAAAQSFLQFEEAERQVSREVTATWSWIVPPISGSTTPVFHMDHWKDTTLKPNFFYQADPWQTATPPLISGG